MVRPGEPGGAGGDGFRVVPDELDGAGRTAQSTAELVPNETRGVLAASDAAEGGLRGWRTGSELNACTDEWKRLLDELSREMDRQGEKLISTAQNYRKGDEDAAKGLGGSGGDDSRSSDRFSIGRQIGAGGSGIHGGNMPVRGR